MHAVISIRVVRTGELYDVEVSPPDGPGWRSESALTPTEVLARLGELGVHSTVITDALSDADPSWSIAHDAEVTRRRGLASQPTRGVAGGGAANGPGQT